MKVHITHTKQGLPGQTNVLIDEDNAILDNLLFSLGVDYEKSEKASITFWDDAEYHDMFDDTTEIVHSANFKEVRYFDVFGNELEIDEEEYKALREKDIESCYTVDRSFSKEFK
ncbi:hypothetical protein [Lactococcus allomyrinae]|uniref:Uncharacterized protein n=1 Tax=Lactococcus allomyrinae TaxID=2419773 RepID=A0A387B7V0_9LACT|nr:hypothetical protein [Lactococcus allomyrinae]AYF99874.1 hypothetical protein D7I46_01505 [Lactococcus allomyrinae]